MASRLTGSSSMKISSKLWCISSAAVIFSPLFSLCQCNDLSFDLPRPSNCREQANALIDLGLSGIPRIGPEKVLVFLRITRHLPSGRLSGSYRPESGPGDQLLARPA